MAGLFELVEFGDEVVGEDDDLERSTGGFHKHRQPCGWVIFIVDGFSIR